MAISTIRNKKVSFPKNVLIDINRSFPWFKGSQLHWHSCLWLFFCRRSRLHFFISHLARCLRTRRFSEPTFRPSGGTNHWKNRVFRDFPTFSRACICFLLTLFFFLSSNSFFLLPLSFFYSSVLDSSPLCFSSVHIVGSFTSKLPSMI